jgi:hypothetical protein
VKRVFLVSLVLGLTLLGGCSIKPWVQPYERANLADPIMSFNRDPVRRVICTMSMTLAKARAVPVSQPAVAAAVTSR